MDTNVPAVLKVQGSEVGLQVQKYPKMAQNTAKPHVLNCYINLSDCLFLKNKVDFVIKILDACGKINKIDAFFSLSLTCKMVSHRWPMSRSK